MVFPVPHFVLDVCDVEDKQLALTAVIDDHCDVEQVKEKEAEDGEADKEVVEAIVGIETGEEWSGAKDGSEIMVHRS